MRTVFSSTTSALKVALFLCLVSTISLVVRPVHLVLDRPLDEDGFYCLAIARNIARGLGISADGETLTNGFQPLWILLLAPLFQVADGDRILGVRLVLLLSALVHFFAGLLLARFIVRVVSVPDRERKTLFWITLILFCSSAVIWLHSFNGLETGLLLFMYSVVLFSFTYLQLGERVSEILFGMLLGVLVLARIDAGFFVAFLLLLILLTDIRSLFDRIKSILVMGLSATLVSLPWWLWNVLEFGHVMPTSGRALQEFAISGDRFVLMAKALAINLTPSIYLGAFESAISILLRLILVFLMSLTVVSFVRNRERCKNFKKAGVVLLSLAATSIFLAAWYSAFSWASFFYLRYMAPLTLVGVMLLSLAALQILRFLASRQFPACIGFSAFFVIGPVLGVTVIAQTGIIFQGHSMLHHQLPLVLSTVPEGEWVASTQSGTLSFMRDRVLNLDGRVNSETLSRQSELAEYLVEKNVRWLVDWPDRVQMVLGAKPELRGWHMVDQYESMVAYRFVGF